MTQTTTEHESRKKIKQLIAEKGEIELCTNTMLRWGRVFHCKVNENGEAIAHSKTEWNGMHFGQIEKLEESKNLGKLRVSTYPRGFIQGDHLVEGNG